MAEFEILKLVLGIFLVMAGVICFSIWREKFQAQKEEDRLKFLMHNIVGGSWVLAVFFVCGGFYCVLSPLLAQLHS